MLRNPDTPSTTIFLREVSCSRSPLQKSLPGRCTAIRSTRRCAARSCSKAECLAYINEVWTDMRPLSLRQQMDATKGT
jgi:uncharacterized protein YbdZ (MbtH family)